MPDSWDAIIYRQPAEAWRQRAVLLEHDGQRGACLAIAEGYERLAGLIESEAQRIQS